MSSLISAVEAYIDFVLSPSRQDQAKGIKTATLIGILDDLAIQARQPGTFVEYEDHDIDRLIYQDTYHLIGKHFPDFGNYPVPRNILNPVDAETGLADAIDDLTDIAIDLQEVLAIAKNIGEAAARYAFISSYRIHWGTHLRDLQRYLHSQLIGY